MNFLMQIELDEDRLVRNFELGGITTCEFNNGAVIEVMMRGSLWLVRGPMAFGDTVSVGSRRLCLRIKNWSNTHRAWEAERL